MIVSNCAFRSLERAITPLLPIVRVLSIAAFHLVDDLRPGNRKRLISHPCRSDGELLVLAGQDRTAGPYSRAGLFAAMLGALVELDQHARVLGVADVLAAAARGRLHAVEVLGAGNRALCEQANAAWYAV